MATTSTATAWSASSPSASDQSVKFNLSLYEQSRTAQQMHPDDFEITIPDDDEELKALFQCTICDELLVKSMTSIRCAHRFCEKCLLNDNCKQCPKCQVKLVGQECRYDSRMDALIRLIFTESDNSTEQSTSSLPPTEPKGMPVVIAPYDNQSSRRYLKLNPNCTLAHLGYFIQIKNRAKRSITFYHQVDSEQLTPLNDDNRSIGDLYQDEERDHLDDQVLELFFDLE